jgi:hypothetical protein
MPSALETVYWIKVMIYNIENATVRQQDLVQRLCSVGCLRNADLRNLVVETWVATMEVLWLFCRIETKGQKYNSRYFSRTYVTRVPSL